MVDATAIFALERAAANLDRLLCAWTKARVDETESKPKAPPQPEDLGTINAGIQSLWRLVAIHKSIEQLKNPPEPSPLTKSEPHPAAQAKKIPLDPIEPKAPRPLPSAPAQISRPAPHAAHAPATPYVPSVPLVPSLGSLDRIIASTDRVISDVAALLKANGLPVPEPAAVAPDRTGVRFLDALTGRAKYPGSGNLLGAILSDLKSTPP